MIQYHTVGYDFDKIHKSSISTQALGLNSTHYTDVIKLGFNNVVLEKKVT